MDPERMTLPIFLNLRGKLAVVVGGGPVGRRKSQTLLESGAVVRLVCLEEGSSLPRLQWIRDTYSINHLQGASLVFAAANPALNRQIVADARLRGLWVNSSDDPEEGDFHLPAILARGNLSIAVSTSGVAPALARKIRDRLAGELDEAFEVWLALLAEMRPVILDKLIEPSLRRSLFESLTDWHWLDRLREQGPESVRFAMQGLVEAAVRR